MNIDLYVADLANQSDPTDLDARAIEVILNNESMKRTLGLLMQEVNGKQVRLSKTKLANQEGVFEAVALQGEISGMQRIFDLFLEVIEMREKKEENHGI